MRKPTKIQGPVTKLPIAHLYTKKEEAQNPMKILARKQLTSLLV